MVGMEKILKTDFTHIQFKQFSIHTNAPLVVLPPYNLALIHTETLYMLAGLHNHPSDKPFQMNFRYTDFIHIQHPPRIKQYLFQIIWELLL
jgi:hypothetical protein